MGEGREGKGRELVTAIFLGKVTLLSDTVTWHFPDKQKPIAEDEDETEGVKERRIRHLVPSGSAMYTISSFSPVWEEVTGEQVTKQSSSLVLRSHVCGVPFGNTELSAEQTSLL